VTPRTTRLLFSLSVVGLGALLVWGYTGLPDFGHFAGEYGRILNGATLHERHVTNVVVAITFDYRGFDTMGEEFILFAAVMGVALLLREARDDTRGHDEVRTDAVRVVGLLLVGPTVVLGLVIVAHGVVTPGGGFQGGVALAAALVLLYAAGRYRALRDASPQQLVDLAEGVGTGGYVAIGIAALFAGGLFLQNFIGLDTAGTITSGGTIPFLNWSTALAVSAGVVLLFHEYLEEVMSTE
jgi:multicomponent Na+:H+ antiporter subunit B